MYLSKGIGILSEKELESIKFLISSFENAQQFPTRTVFEIKHPHTAQELDGVTPIIIDDFRVYVYNMIKNRANNSIAERMEDVKRKIALEGMTDPLMEKLEEYNKLSNKNKSKKVDIQMDFSKIYAERALKSSGLVTGIAEIDKHMGGMSEGTITTIAGFTSHFKTTFALNIAHRNCYHYGYNIIYLSLETPKEDMYFNLLCRHSYEREFSKYSFIPHGKMRRCELGQEEKEELYNVIEPSLTKDYYVGSELSRRGRVIILDESDFASLSFSDIYNTFESIDNQLGGNLDGFMVDYVQLCKFVDTMKNSDDNRIINSYVTFFRRLAMKFRAGKNKKKLIGVLLAQINRSNWIKSSRCNGRYDLTCLADANELERGSYRVLTTYTTEDMKAIKEAQVQILKNRGGQTMWDSYKVYADGEAYVFGEEFDTFGSSMGGVGNSASIGNDFGAYDAIKDQF